MESRKVNMWIIKGMIYTGCIWFRIGSKGIGFSIKRTPKLFSERNGFVKSIPMINGWRLTFLS